MSFDRIPDEFTNSNSSNNNPYKIQDEQAAKAEKVFEEEIIQTSRLVNGKQSRFGRFKEGRGIGSTLIVAFIILLLAFFIFIH